MKTITRNTIEDINEGSLQAFENLYNTHYAYMCVVATKYVYDIETAREIVNDVFVNLWQNRQSLSYPILPYLIKAIQNRCINYLRSHRLNTVSLTEEEIYLYDLRESMILSDSHPLQNLINKEINKQIKNAVDELPPRCREIFSQYLYENKSYEEIAQNMNISTSTVRVQVKIGITKIKASLIDTQLFLLFTLFFIKN